MKMSLQGFRGFGHWYTRQVTWWRRAQCPCLSLGRALASWGDSHTGVAARDSQIRAVSSPCVCVPRTGTGGCTVHPDVTPNPLRLELRPVCWSRNSWHSYGLSSSQHHMLRGKSKLAFSNLSYQIFFFFFFLGFWMKGWVFFP